MKLFKGLFFLLSISFLFFSSCKKDQLLTDSSAKLEFSTDSVLFDTVFKYAGSTTKLFTIHNRHKQTMNISKIFLASGSNSAYTLNVDGISGKSLTDIEILGNDSLYVFVQVHVTPSQSAPLLIKDSIIFETNGNTQDVKLTAIGQNVHLIKPDHFPTNGFPPYSIIGRSGFDTTLINDLPYLVFGYAVVDSACKLTISPGVHMYFHNYACLFVYKEGTLIVDGITKGNEVTFQGDRLEIDYKELPGQWRGIWLSALSKNNFINWSIIKNATIGIQSDTVSSTTAATLKLTNTIVKNMQVAALYGQGTRIWSSNCLFANCGQYVAALTIGGSYKFEQCTFANYWTGSQRTTSTLALNNYYSSGGTTYIRPLDSCYFGNCIIYGDIADEIGLDSASGAGVPPNIFSFKFNHCIIKSSLNTNSSLHYNTVYKNTYNPDFKDISLNNYELKSSSQAIDKGDTGIVIPFDLNGVQRPNTSTSIPDLGAYEFY